jgi:hypothetical protein
MMQASLTRRHRAQGQPLARVLQRRRRQQLWE